MARAFLFALVLASGFTIAGAGAHAAGAPQAAKEKHCKKTQRLHKGKCVRKQQPSASPSPQAPDPMSDADGDGLPYQWEAAPQAPAGPGKCTSKQRLQSGKCVPKCKKGRRLKHGKCVKRKPVKRSRATARASIATASVASLGADPNHKDIFVQIDYASEALRQNVACGELDAIVGAFANAPVANPDGKPGINLHIDAGISCPSRNYNLGGSQIFNAGSCPGTGQAMLAAELPESRVGAFHIAGFSPTCGGGGAEGGAAQFRGVKMVVFTDGPSFAHVLMHELGHNLGLDHPNGYQPNRISTMNTRLEVSDSGSGSTEALDFQRFSLPALDENNLNEAAGISAPPEAHRFYVLHFCEGSEPSKNTFPYAWPGDGAIDWNCNSPSPFSPPTIDLVPVSADVNGDGQRTVLPATGPEWPTLDYASGGQIGPR
jgi:hypothetical protein